MLSKENKSKLSKLFATEELSKAVLSMGIKQQCLASYCGFKQYGESYEHLQHKQLFFPGFDEIIDLQQEYNAPLFTICPALTWQQISDWFRDEHDMDIDVVKIRQDPEFKFSFSVMSAGILVDSSRTVDHYDAWEKAVKCAIDYKLSNS